VIALSPALKAARAQATAAALSGGSAELYAGALPAPGAAPAGALLAQWALGALSASGAQVVIAPAPVMAQADGAPALLRLLDAQGAWLADLDVGPPPAPGEPQTTALVATPALVYAGGQVSLSALTLAEP